MKTAGGGGRSDPGLIDVNVVIGTDRATGARAGFGELRAALRRLPARIAVVSDADTVLTNAIEVGNGRLLDALAGHPDLRAWLVLHPLFAEESERTLRAWAGHPGVAGVRLSPDLGRYALGGAFATALLTLIEACALPVLVDIEIGGACTARVAAQTAARFPRISFVLARMGVCEGYHSGIEAILEVGAPNIFLDTSALESWFTGYLAFAVASIGADRLLFGSGAPFMRSGALYEALRIAEISPADRRRIMSENAIRILRLPAQ